MGVCGSTTSNSPTSLLSPALHHEAEQVLRELKVEELAAAQARTTAALTAVVNDAKATLLQARLAGGSAAELVRDADLAQRWLQGNSSIEHTLGVSVVAPGHQHDRGGDDSAQLPPELRAFPTLASMPGVAEVYDTADLAEAEHAVLARPGNEAVAAYLRQKASVIRLRLQAAIHERFQDPREMRRVCHATVEAGNADLSRVYGSVWRTIEHADPEGLQIYRDAFAALTFPAKGAKQRSEDPVELYRDSARVLPDFKAAMAELVDGVARVELLMPDSLKAMGRIVEKSLFRVDQPGNADQIFDVVRCTVQCKGMRQVAEVVRRVNISKKLELVGATERFELEVSSGGWRDCTIIFTVEDEDGNCRVICELRIVVKVMMTARQGLPSDAITDRVRTASDLLQTGPGQFRPRSKKELRRMVLDWIAGKRDKLKPIEMWDTSLVTDMSELFKGQQEFNNDIRGWDTSRVTNMAGMFDGCSSFNQPIGSWDTSRVTSMKSMFQYASSFNQPLARWDTSRVANMESMFFFAQSFDQPLGTWNTSRVTNMRAMFSGAKSFDQPLGGWDMRGVTSMWAMFDEAKATEANLNQMPLSKQAPAEEKTQESIASSSDVAGGGQAPLLTRPASYIRRDLDADRTGKSGSSSAISTAAAGHAATVEGGGADDDDESKTRSSQDGDAKLTAAERRQKFERLDACHDRVTSALTSMIDEAMTTLKGSSGGGGGSGKSATPFVRQWHESVAAMKVELGLLQASGHLRDHDDDEGQMPPELRAFPCLASMPGVIEKYKALNLANAERAVVLDPASEEAATDLRQKVSVIERQLQAAIDQRLRDPREMRRSCSKALEAGNADFSRVYGSVWRTIEHADPEGLQMYRDAFAALTFPAKGNKQRSGDPVELYRDSARVLPDFKAAMAELVDGLANVKLAMPNSLKAMGRIVEKSLLRVDDRGNADQIFDVVRCMVQCKGMRQVAEVVRRVINSKTLELVRAKERFELEVSGGGWRDCMINFIIRDQDGNLVICELQIVVEAMMTARQGLPGHAIYIRVRTASELLEVGPGKFRPQSNEELRQMVSDWCAGKRDELKPIEMWDTSLITDMSELFLRQTDFNDDIRGWDTSRVTNMAGMFDGASSFNRPIGSWDTSQVTSMASMFGGVFGGAEAFNQPLERWDTSRVTSMASMFYGAQSFNHPLGKWDTSRVISMKSMFSGASSFDQPLDSWDTSQVTTMESMFQYASSFKSTLGNWDTGQVRSKRDMFDGCKATNSSLKKITPGVITRDGSKRKAT